MPGYDYLNTELNLEFITTFFAMVIIYMKTYYALQSNILPYS